MPPGQFAILPTSLKLFCTSRPMCRVGWSSGNSTSRDKSHNCRNLPIKTNLKILQCVRYHLDKVMRLLQECFRSVEGPNGFLGPKGRA